MEKQCFVYNVIKGFFGKVQVNINFSNTQKKLKPLKTFDLGVLIQLSFLISIILLIHFVEVYILIKKKIHIYMYSMRCIVYKTDSMNYLRWI